MAGARLLTRRLTVATFSAAVLGSVVGVLATFGACSGTTPTAAQGPATPAAVPPGATTARPGAPLPDLGSLHLEQFTPLLALPELQAAARAADEEKPAAAALEVERVLQARTVPEDDLPRWQLLLGRLHERAGNLPAALAAYEIAASRTWQLTGYSRLLLGRAALRAGHHKRAIQKLRDVPSAEPAAFEAQLLTVEAALASGDRQLALATWRQHLHDAFGGTATLIALDLAEALLTDSGAQGAVEALALARHVSSRDVDQRAGTRAAELERRALEAMPAAERAVRAKPSRDEALARINALVEARRGDEAVRAADELIANLPTNETYSKVGCEAAVLRGRALALVRQWGRAADLFVDPIRYCTEDSDLRARLLFLAGKYASSDKRHTLAVQRYEQLEKEVPGHRLADDARLNAALAYLEVGVEARFTELLGRMPDDYPGGDMMLEGVFRLALRRIERGDWSAAASVLDRATALLRDKDSARGLEFSGRERYFRARAWMETGERERGVNELEAIVRELPLSYYMLHAYSRLSDLDRPRAERARDESIAAAASQPFAFERRDEFELPGFRRGIELLRQGDVEFAKRELDALKFDPSSTAPGVLWGMALLYARAGAARESHSIARGLLTDWLRRWPAGDWTRAWEIAFPRPHAAIVAREAKKNDVPEALVYAVMREESAFDARAVSSADAYGLMQLIVPTAASAAKPLGLPSDAEALKRPTINIALGSRTLAKLRSRFSDNPWLAIPGYNAGPGRPARWLKERPQLDFDVWVETIPFVETRRYTKRVLASQAAYAFVYRKPEDPLMTLPTRLTPPKSDAPSDASP
jgi:soluble lytic murein transglycosylase